MTEINDVQYGVMRTTAEMYFTGGIRGYQSSKGWKIKPFLLKGEIKEIGPFAHAHIKQVANELDIIPLGVNEIVWDDPNLPSEIWHPLINQISGMHSSADMWGSISSNASIAKDDKYANLAQNIEISLRASDLRLRDASHQYFRQLFAALARGMNVNLRFVNIALSDLYLAFHSLLAEMGATRDYLSAIVAIHINAPSKIDSLARLIDWAQREVNASVLNHKIFRPFLEGWSEGDKWLFELGEYRNTFLHREPMGVNGIERGAAIVDRETHFGRFHKLKLDIPSLHIAGVKTDALDRFVNFYNRLHFLASQIAVDAKYSSTPQSFIVSRSKLI
jgi:hypothetical protein